MAKCKHCGKEQNEPEEREFNGLICRSIEQFGVAYKNIVIPDGWRLPNIQEVVDLVNNVEFCEWSKCLDGKHDFYYKQPFNKNNGKYGAWFGCSSNGFDLLADNVLDYNYASRGVLLVRKK